MAPVRLTVADAVAEIRVDNPPVNAMSAAVLAALDDAVTQVAADPSVRAVVITATGSASFLSGADLDEMPTLLADPEALVARTAQVADLFARLAALPQPTVAAVQASAVGGGLELLLVCDLVVLADDARLALPEVRLGLIPGAGGTQRLVRRLPHQRAAEMVLLGTGLSAADALATGLAARVVPAADVLGVAHELATRLTALPQVAVRAAKAALTLGRHGTLAEGLQVEREQFVRAAASVDAREGVEAFMQRRKPAFTHH